MSDELIDQGDRMTKWVGKTTLRKLEQLGWRDRTPADIIEDALEAAVRLREIQEVKGRELREREQEIEEVRELFGLAD